MFLSVCMFIGWRNILLPNSNCFLSLKINAINAIQAFVSGSLGKVVATTVTLHDQNQAEASFVEASFCTEKVSRSFPGPSG